MRDRNDDLPTTAPAAGGRPTYPLGTSQQTITSAIFNSGRVGGGGGGVTPPGGGGHFNEGSVTSGAAIDHESKKDPRNTLMQHHPSNIPPHSELHSFNPSPSSQNFHESYDSFNNGKFSTKKSSNSPGTLSPTCHSNLSSIDEVTSSLPLNSSLNSLSYSTVTFPASFSTGSTNRSLCFVCLDNSADGTLPINKDFLKDSFPSYSKDILNHKGVCSKCYRKLTELETLQSFKQFCDLMFEEAKSELEQLFDLSRHARMLMDFEQQQHLRMCLSNAQETNLIGSLQVDDEQIPSSFINRQKTSRSSATLDSDHNTGSSPISSAGDSSSSKPNSGTSSTHDRTASGGGGGGGAGGGVNVSTTNGGVNATRRKHKSCSLKQTPGRLLGCASYEDDDAAYFGSQSSAGGGGLDGGDTGGVSTPVLSHFRSQLSHPQAATTINPSLLLETLSWRIAAHENVSPSSIAGQPKKKQTSPFQNFSFESQSGANGSRVNLNLQLAETLIKDAIRTASFDAGYSEVDFTNVSVDICLDSSNSVKPVQLNLTHKQPSSCDTTPVRSFAEVNGDPIFSEMANNKMPLDQGAPNSISQPTKPTKKRYPVLESSPLTNPLHIDASNFHTSTPSSSPLELPRNSSAESLKTTNLSMTSFASPSSTPGALLSKSVPPTNRNRFYQFKPKDKTSTSSNPPDQNIDHVTMMTPQSDSTSAPAQGAGTGTSYVHVPRKASSGVAMTTSTSSTSISKLRMPNIKATNSYFDDDMTKDGSLEAGNDENDNNDENAESETSRSKFQPNAAD